MAIRWTCKPRLLLSSLCPEINSPLNFSSAYEGEFFRALCRLYHRLDQGDAQLALLEFQNAVNRAAGGGGDSVLEQSRMVPGFKDDLSGTHRGLCCQKGRDVSGKTHLNSGLRQGFQDDVNIGGAAGR